jgi:hypothetical protein
MGKYLLLYVTVFIAFCSKAQVSYDGSLVEGYWGMPLATSAGGPATCNSGLRLNSLFATANDSSICLGIGGTLQSGHQLLVFIDSKTGGETGGTFGRAGAPAGLLNLPPGTRFDAGFTADYCLIISNNATTTNATVQLFSINSIGAVATLASVSAAGTTLAPGCRFGLSPAAADFTKGYELSLPRTLLGYNPPLQAGVKFMAMIVGDDGSLSNQFLTHADALATACFGKGTNGTGIQFQNDAAINPVGFNPSQSLPIDFLNVKAFQVGQAIKVYWTSATEKDMLAYQIERSTDALQYSTIGRLSARGNTSGQTAYEYADVQPLLGKSFYRVKAVDINGRSTYSAIVKMQFGRVDNTLTIYPNPVVDQINLQIIGLKPDSYRMQVFNDLGQCLIEKTIVYTGGYGLHQIPLLPNMKKGPYRLLLRNRTWFYKQNFLVQ